MPAKCAAPLQVGVLCIVFPPHLNEELSEAAWIYVDMSTYCKLIESTLKRNQHHLQQNRIQSEWTNVCQVTKSTDSLQKD
jgi:hypothetical protein